jgi:hypothetical protein
MSTHLLDLPTEILNQILTPLPTRSLLRFSETSHHARSLANANLHTLSLAIAPLPSPLFKDLDQSITTTSTTTPYAICLRIPKAASHEHATLLAFQSALVGSILQRHGTMLQHLELSVWALTLPMAEAVAGLRALRTFSLRIESQVRYVRGVPRSRMGVEREEQGKAWEVLVKSARVWSQRLTKLNLENCDLDAGQLAMVLKESRECKELGLNRCRHLGREMWTSLGEWEGRGKLGVLSVADCGGMLGKEARGAVDRLHGLQVCYSLILVRKAISYVLIPRQSLNLYDCQEQQPGEFERLNSVLWLIPDFAAPRLGGYGENMIIEVDPDYIF